MNRTELRSFSHFQIFHLNLILGPQQKSGKLTDFEVCLHSLKTVKVSQDDQIRMYTWFTSVFLLNGTELRSFSHFQIFSKITYSDLSWKLQNWLFLEFFFIHCKTVKDSQNDQIRMQTWFTSAFSMNGTELRSFSHFQISTWIVYLDLSRILENWLILMFAFIHCKTVKVSQNHQIRI